MAVTAAGKVIVVLENIWQLRMKKRERNVYGRVEFERSEGLCV